MWRAILLLLFAWPLAAAAGDGLRILAVEEPPVSYTAAGDGKPAGYAIDVVRELQRRVGSDAAIEVEPESRVYATGLRQPGVVMLSFSRTPDRENSFHWIARIARKPWIFYGRGDGNTVLRTLDDARRLRAIAVVTGDVRAQWLQSAGMRNLVQAADPAQAISLLQAGRVDAVFSEPQSIAYYCHTGRCGKVLPRALWAPRVSDVYILMSKRTPAAEVARWRAAAKAMADDGAIAKIARRWQVMSDRQFGTRTAVRHGVLDFCGDTPGC